MTNVIGNGPAVQPPQSFLQRVGSAIVSGLKAIGNKLAEFGHAISNLFSKQGQAAANAPDHTDTKGVTPQLTSDSVGLSASEKERRKDELTTPRLPSVFTAEEKRILMDAARESAFYQALAGSTDSQFSQEAFEKCVRAVLSTPQAVLGMREHGVTLDEAVAISFYTSQSYVKINGALREGSADPVFTTLADAFTSGLKRLPSFEGNVFNTQNGDYYQTFRGAKLPKEAGEKYLEGLVVSDPGILSSTYNPDEEFKGVNYSITLLCKPGSEGKDISMFSDKPTECEVAFPPNVQFTVLNRHLDSGGRLPPEMERTYHPGFMGDNGPPMAVVNLVMMEI